MLKNPNYLYGEQTTCVPVKLNFGDFMIRRLLQHQDRIAITNAETNESVTYHEIAQDAMNLAISLAHLGVRKGESAAIYTENRLEFFGAVIGIACTGAELSLVWADYTNEDEIKHVFNLAKPKYIFCSPKLYEKHRYYFQSLCYVRYVILFGEEKYSSTLLYNELVRPKQSGKWLTRNIRFDEFEPVKVQGQIDTLFILFSSGTTGPQKAAMLTHLNFIATCQIVNPVVHEEAHTVSLNISPWCHVYGLILTLCNLARAKKLVFLPNFELESYVKAIEKYKITHITVVPPILQAICRNEVRNDLSSVRVIASATAALHKDILSGLKCRFPNLKAIEEFYGSTEVLSVTTGDGDMRTSDPGCIGFVIQDTVIKVVDVETRQPLGPYKHGEICIAGATVMSGYKGEDRQQQFDDEGFFKSGDIGYYDDKKCIYIVDRVKELIKYRDHQVSPLELEAVLLQHEAVRDAGVIGIPHQEWKEVPIAFVVIEPGKRVSEKELKDYVAVKLPNHKHLRGGVRFISRIPKLPCGKILRRELKHIFNSLKMM